MMQKRIVSLFLVALMAVGMMLVLSSCGKKSLEEYFEMEEMQTQVTALKQQFESQGMTADIYASGDAVCFDVTLNMEVPADSLEAVQSQLNEALSSMESTFGEMAKQLQDNSTNENVTIKVTYTDSTGTELASASFAAAE